MEPGGKQGQLRQFGRWSCCGKRHVLVAMSPGRGRPVAGAISTNSSAADFATACPFGRSRKESIALPVLPMMARAILTPRQRKLSRESAAFGEGRPHSVERRIRKNVSTLVTGYRCSAVLASGAKPHLPSHCWHPEDLFVAPQHCNSFNQGFGFPILTPPALLVAAAARPTRPEASGASSNMASLTINEDGDGSASLI